MYIPISSPVKKSKRRTHMSSPPAIKRPPFLGSREADSTVHGISQLFTSPKLQTKYTYNLNFHLSQAYLYMREIGNSEQVEFSVPIPKAGKESSIHLFISSHKLPKLCSSDFRHIKRRMECYQLFFISKAKLRYFTLLGVYKVL